MNNPLTFASVHDRARGRWPEILPALGIAPNALRNRHGPCPGCGGRDRFRFDDREIGRFYCSGGGADPVSGDGFALLQHVYGWTAREALERVAELVSPLMQADYLPSVASQAKPTPPRRPGNPRTAVYARELWLKANKDDNVVGGHPYARQKGIDWAAGAGRASASGCIVGRDADCLVIPIKTVVDERLVAVQCINMQGRKQTFGPMGDDGCLLLGNTLDRFIPWIVVEGWADAVSVAFHVHEGNAVAAAAFGINRMEKVARAVAECFQPAEIVILEDAA
jgi:phage/plasmid primase-like uncharacterized protein